MKDICLACAPYFQCAKHLSLRPRRKIIGVKISDDFGKTWKPKAVCEECLKNIEPPTMVKTEIPAGTFTCDFCGVINVIYKPKKLKNTLRG